ncbi:hypothetical protein BDA99DRAFT_573314 [Phascolomyces articulosus]|uniref:sn-1-specific diacylglycerol lipase n=1 Tax=Phascolomyces articulosus TaxID=60185 RepID=A0AAD5PCE8_9FUNG|nr:hypothetical protein BDA99DRAFT_573314 [Phascolomyces articulosus]
MAVANLIAKQTTTTATSSTNTNTAVAKTTSTSTEIITYNPIQSLSTTLLPTHIANFITAVSLAARLSLRCSSLLIEALFETAKYSTVFSFGFSRQALINAVSTAKKLHALTYPSNSDDGGIDPEKGVFLQILDKYTTLGVYVIHHSFTLAELFALSGLQFTSNTIQTGLKAAEESVQVIDGIFGSNETSRAIASIITMVHQELIQDPEFELAKNGKMAVLGGLTKALTAFAVLQNVTHKRTMEYVKVTKMWKGLVIEDDDDEGDALVPYQRATSPIGYGGDEDETDVLHELEEILAHNESTTSMTDSSLSLALQEGGSAAHWGSAYPMYEISTATRHTITRTTKIRPIAAPGQPQPKAKYIVVKSDQEDNESFMAVIDQDDGTIGSEPIPGAWIEHSMDDHDKNGDDNNKNRTLLKSPSKGLKIMLSAVSKKFSKKKVERQVKYARDDRDVVGRSIVHHGSIETLDLSDEDDNEDDDRGYDHDSFDRDITTTLSTTRSATLRSAQYSSTTTATSNEKPLPLPPPPPKENQKQEGPPGDRTIKRKSSWGRLKLKGSRRKSVTSLFQKGAEALNASNRKKQESPPPLPSSSSRHLNTSSIAMASRSSVTSTTTTHHHRGRSNSITSVSSAAHTMTATYITAPSSPSSSTLFRSSQQQQHSQDARRQQQSYRPDRSERRTKSIVRSPSAPSKNRKKRKHRSPLDSEPDPRNFPRKHIINNIAHFMRYASAAYGEAFMRILRIGDIPSVLPNSHHPNHHAFSHHTGVAVEDILLSSYTDTVSLAGSVQHPQLHALVHYVTVDHSCEAIVLTCRGTLGLSDVLTDLMCEYTEFSLPTDNSIRFKAHGGMLEAAQLLAKQKGKVYQSILEGLESHPGYGLVLCGHSLGAGVAALLSILWSEERASSIQRTSNSNAIALAALARDPVPFVTSQQSGLPPGRPIHCYTYGPPCTMSLELSDYCGRGLVTSVVHGYDIVPCLSLGLLRDFKNVAVSLYQEASVADDILRRVIGRKTGSSHSQQEGGTKDEDTPMKKIDDDENDQWYWAMIKTMRADMREDKLYPPGTLYLIESTAQLTSTASSPKNYYSTTNASTATKNASNGTGGGKKKHAHMVVLNRCDNVQARFSEIMFARTMFMDHSPNMYENAIRQLCRGFFGEQGAYERL